MGLCVGWGGRWPWAGWPFLPSEPECEVLCNSKNELRSGSPAPKMGPFPEPSVIVPILEGSRNGLEFRAHFWPRFSSFLNAGFRLEMLQAGIAVKVTTSDNLCACEKPSDQV